MNKLIWKLLRQHISIGQFTGFFFSNLVGMTIILLGIQFYTDIMPMFTQGDSFMKEDYLIVSKRISTLGAIGGKSNTFSQQEIGDIQSRSFTREVGIFTTSQFNVSAGINIPEAGIRMSTAMFFEAVPDRFIDVNLDKWHFNDSTEIIPIIIPRNYLNLYNFGFAQSRNMPSVSEGMVGLLNMDVNLRGNGKQRQFKGNIVGFSNRLNTILVPQSFMDWANNEFAPGKEIRPSRLIIQTGNPADEAIAQYFKDKGYETENDKLDAGKTVYFLRIISGIVLAIGLLISILSVYVLMLSIFLLLQKNSTKLENLLLTGYTPSQIGLPYRVLSIGLNLLTLILSLIIVFIARSFYLDIFIQMFPQLMGGSIWLMIGIGIAVFAVISLINSLVIGRHIQKLFHTK